MLFEFLFSLPFLILAIIAALAPLATLGMVSYLVWKINSIDHQCNCNNNESILGGSDPQHISIPKDPSSPLGQSTFQISGRADTIDFLSGLNARTNYGLLIENNPVVVLAADDSGMIPLSGLPIFLFANQSVSLLSDDPLESIGAQVNYLSDAARNSMQNMQPIYGNLGAAQYVIDKNVLTLTF